MYSAPVDSIASSHQYIVTMLTVILAKHRVYMRRHGPITHAFSTACFNSMASNMHTCDVNCRYERGGGGRRDICHGGGSRFVFLALLSSLWHSSSFTANLNCTLDRGNLPFRSSIHLQIVMAPQQLQQDGTVPSICYAACSKHHNRWTMPNWLRMITETYLARRSLSRNHKG